MSKQDHDMFTQAENERDRQQQQLDELREQHGGEWYNGYLCGRADRAIETVNKVASEIEAKYYKSDEVEQQFIDRQMQIADSYPRDDEQERSADMVEMYERGICSKTGAALP